MQIKYCYTKYVGISYEFNLFRTAFDVSGFETMIFFQGFVRYFKQISKRNMLRHLLTVEVNNLHFSTIEIIHFNGNIGLRKELMYILVCVNNTMKLNTRHKIQVVLHYISRQ